jgi:tartrate dehydrogenase/decarboxylase/D-malate dehydrogenase
MMLEHLGQPEAAAVLRGIETVLGDADAPKTQDLGGRANTEELGRAIAGAIARG